MGQEEARFSSRLRDELWHRLRPMTGRDPNQRGRSATPIELFYDLTFVVAFGAAAEQLAHSVGEGHVVSGLGAYVFAIFAISWAWMNYTWFASAYGNDDVLFRLATLVQMVGVVILLFGLPTSFAAAAEGQSPADLTMVIGYLVIRISQMGLWVRVSVQDPHHRRLAVIRVITMTLAQVGWLLTVLVAVPTVVTNTALLVLAIAEMIAPALVERRLGNIPWNAGHVAERFGLLTLVALGEVVAATVSAVASLIGAQGWTLASVTIIASGLVLAMGFWWAYFQVPSRPILEQWPQRVFVWRYAHLPIFGAIAAVGAGLRVTAAAVEHESLSVAQIALALAIPAGGMILMIFVTWSVLMRSLDAVHLPLFLAAMVPLVAAVLVGASAGSGPLSVDDPASMRALVIVIALVALCPVVEVIEHEVFGYSHTMRVVERDLAKSQRDLTRS